MNNNLLTIELHKEYVASVITSGWPRNNHILESRYLRVEQQEKQEAESVKSVLKKLTNSIEKPYSRILFSAPACSFYFRTIELPFKNESKIKSVLPFELESILPLTAEEIITDFFILDNQIDGGASPNRILAACIQKSTYEFYQRLLDECHLQVDILTIGSNFSSAILFAQQLTNKKGTVIFIHIDFSYAALYCIRHGEVSLVRSFPLEQSTETKKAANLCSNIKRTILSTNELFQSKTDTEQIVLSGPLSESSIFSEHLQYTFDISIDRFNVLPYFKNKDHGIKERFFGENLHFLESPAATASCMEKGLLWFNFIKRASIFHSFFNENKPQIISAFVLSLLCLTAWLSNPLLQMHFMNHKIKQLDNQIVRTISETFPDMKVIPYKEAEQMEKRLDKLRKKQVLPEKFERYIPAIDILNEISIHLPSSLDLTLTRLVKTEKTLLITGNTDGFNTVDQMKNRLSKVGFFKKVDINSASMDKVENRVKFTMKISI